MKLISLCKTMVRRCQAKSQEMARILAAITCISCLGQLQAEMRPLLGGEPTREDLSRAVAQLSAWEKDAEKAPRVCRVVYWTPADREPLAEYRERLSRVLTHIQDFYRREMVAWGLGERTIQLEKDQDGLVKIYVAKGKLKSEECSESDSSDGQAIKRDAYQALQEQGKIDGAQETVVIFCNLADWDAEKRQMSHHSPYYAGGDSRSGTAWQLDSPLLDAKSLGEKGDHLRDKQYGLISLGKYNSIFVGGVCHELGHALGLPHCKESAAARAERGTALMGSGNRTYGEELRGESKGSFLTLPHAMKLAAHPQFSGSVKQMQERGKATFSDWELSPTERSLKVTAKVEATLPVVAVLAYADGQGGSDYDAEIAVGIPHANGRVEITLPPPQKKGVPAQLNLVTVFANGAATAGVSSGMGMKLPITFTKEGTYDVLAAKERFATRAYLKAREAGSVTPESLTAWGATIEAIHERLAKPDSAAGKTPPAQVEASVALLPLSDTAPASAQTGYGGVHFDRRDADSPLITPQGLVPHGLWAHADSAFAYDLGKKWRTLEGSLAFLEGAHGKVQATILGDGKELWNSGEVTVDAASKPFTLDVSAVSELQLQIKAIGGKAGTWSIWSTPLLKR